MSDFPKTRIRFRRGTAAEWSAANPVILASGEPGFVVDSNTLKIGDGQTAFASLSAVAGGGGGGGSLDNIVEDTTPQLGGNLDVNSKNIIGTGNVALTGSGTFTSIIKTGGTSSQFLKADGSVDSSTYLTDIVNDTTPSLGGELNLDNKDIVIDAKNNDGTQIDAGTPVYVVGYHAGSSKPLIAPADASDSTKMPAIGITNDDIAGSAEGTVGVMGIVGGIDTTSPVSFTIGDVVYVANGGGLTNVKPTTAAHLIQNLGRVTKINASNGRILLLGAGRVNDIPNSGTFSGNIEAASFIKNGGTSSQFLKADGSVDSNTYLTSSSSLSNVVEDTSPQLGGALDAQSNNITSVGSLGVGGGVTFEKGLTVNNAGAGTSSDFRVRGDSDTHLLFTDAANDKVGISTEFPSHTFAVSGDINATTIVKQGGTSSQFLKADGSVSDAFYIQGIGNNTTDIATWTNVSSSTAKSISSSLGTRFVIANGKMGVGTADPSHLLSVSGDINATTIIKQGGTSSQFLKADGSVDTNTYSTTDTQLTEEQVEDFVGGMVTGNTETGITVTYQDDDGTMDFVVASQTDENFTTADHSKLDGIEALADVTDAANVTSAGAVMNSGISTASMSFVVDEDNMSSNSATKVPTQQSVKAYVDANAGGGGDVVEDTTPQLGGALDINSNNIIGTGNIAISGTGTMAKIGVGLGNGTPAFNLDVTGSGRFVHTDGGCGLFVQDISGSGLHFGDCALSANANFTGMKHTHYTGTSDYMMVSDGSDTYISAKDGSSVYLRAGGNAAESEIRIHDVGAGGVGIVFNESGADRDIRMESNTSTNMFRLDASADSIGLNTALPSHTLSVSGDINAQNVYVSGAPATKSDTTGITGASGVANLVYISSGDYAALSSYSSSTIYFIR